MLTSSPTYKCIFQGRLEFGSEKSFAKVMRMVEHQVETYYKNEILFKLEEAFDAETYSLNIPRLIVQATEKEFKNTYHLLKYCADFALSGMFGAWMTDQGKILKYGLIEPTGDKVAVQEYLKGRKLGEDPATLEEAITALNRAIEKYDRHSQAYERRGHINFLLQKFHDAERDYMKSVGLDPANSAAWFGLAKAKARKGDTREAIQALEKAIKNSLALQPIYWKARRFKAECHIEAGEMEAAAFELKLFTKREYSADDPNAKHKKRAFFLYGKVLTHLKNYEEAVQAFESIRSASGEISPEEMSEALLLLGMAKQQTGRSGFLPDWKQAAELGSKQAARLLEEHA